MSLESAIAALNPWLWWKLDEASGTTATDYGSGGHPGTFSGDLGLHITGPELGTFATRFFATGKVQSGGLGFTTFNDFSILQVLSAPAAGSPTAYTPIGAIGSPLNVNLRGIVWNIQSLSLDTLRYAQSYNTTVGGNNVPFAFPFPFWHVLITTYVASTHSTSWYADGLAPLTNSSLPANPWQASDPLTLTSTTPFAATHTAVFTRALSSTEVASVSSQIPAWPYQVPANQMVSVPPVTVDLTPVLDDTTQILANQTAGSTDLETTLQNTEDIKGFWNGYQTVTLPSLNEVLGNITTAVTTTVTSATTGVQQTIGELISPHDLGELGSDELTDGPTCDVFEVNISLRPYYGLELRIVEYPDDWQWTTPDHQWGHHDLAVLAIYINDVLILRHGIHTLTHTIRPMPTYPLPWLAFVPTTLTPFGTHVVVHPAAGVCFQLSAQYLP